MEQKCLQKLIVLTVLVMAFVCLNTHLAVAKDDDIVIAPISSTPEGQTYGRWAAEWWQWAEGVPADVNPVTDTTGEHCAQRQVDNVWFLAGSFGSDPVMRKCEIPAGKSLFFPLINTSYGAFLNDPPETRTEEFVREQGSCSSTLPVKISVQIDGFTIPSPTGFFTGPSGSQSPIFNVQLPPGNVFGIVEHGTLNPRPPKSKGKPERAPVALELVLSPSAEQGYYLFVQPLSPGTHTIQWTASGCASGFSQDITYHLTIVGGDPKH